MGSEGPLRDALMFPYPDLGEVENVSPPSSPFPESPVMFDVNDYLDFSKKEELMPVLDRKLSLSVNVNIEMNQRKKEMEQSEELEVPPNKTAVVKGKEKMYEGWAFNNYGLSSQKEVALIDSGELIQYSKAFKRVEIDLEDEVFKGCFVKNILNEAVTETLEEFM